MVHAHTIALVDVGIIELVGIVDAVAVERPTLIVLFAAEAVAVDAMHATVQGFGLVVAQGLRLDDSRAA